MHIPFCPYKCAYCDFVAVPSGPAVSGWHARYLKGLEREAAYWQQALSIDTPPATVFYGGGTPTVLEPAALAHLHQYLVRRFAVSPTSEVTVECNPGTVDLRGLQCLRRAGFNRLSIGLQAWQDALLVALSRWHTRQQFLDAWGFARTAGFDNINVDLMFGLPGQGMEAWTETLDAVVGLHPEHISLYGLQIEEGTPFGSAVANGTLVPPDDAQGAEMYRTAMSMLSAAGYGHYEISNFAQPGRQSRHNRLYWDNDAYIGLGIGAASHWAGARWTNTTRLAVYCATAADGTSDWVTYREAPDPARSQAEGAFLGLRLLEGLDLDAYRSRYGVSLEVERQQQIAALIDRGLLLLEGRRLKLTGEGLLLGNQVFAAFV